MEFELDNPTASFKEHQPDTVPSLFANESDHMPSYHSSRSSRARLLYAFLRREAILQVGKKWISRLLAVSSLSLGVKMNLQLSLSDIQGDDGFNFDAQSVERMELHILATLNWRMRSIRHSASSTPSCLCSTSKTHS